MKNISKLTQVIIDKKNTHNNKRRSSAGRFYTSSAGAVTSLILVVTLSFLTSAFLNLFGFWGLVGTNNTYALDRISMTIDTNNLAIGVVDISTEGKFSQSSNMNISVSTSNYYGYTLSMASSTGSTDLVSNTSTIPSINASIDQATFSDAANTQYSNKWGYKPSTLYDVTNDVSAANTNFLPLPDDTGEIIDKTSEANSTPNTYTLSIGTRIDNTASIGDYISDAFVIAAVANTNTIPCDDTKLCVEYDGNGLMYDNDWLNRVNYNSTTTQEQITKYSHTSNLDDSGNKINNANYPNSLNTNEVITIPGAPSLNISLTYQTESCCDYVSFWDGNYPSYKASSNYSTGVKIGGNTTGKYQNSTKTTVNGDINGDTVTFGFYSDGSVNNYGYYAVITGTSTVIERTVSSGQYATPTGTNALFRGWSTTETTPGGGLPSQVEYANESEILTKMPGDEGETKTLYAVWQQEQTITFTMDSNVRSIAVLNSDGTTAGTITASGQSLVLAQGNTYTLSPSFSQGYITNTITKITGEGTLSNKQFTVGAGSATLNVTSKEGGLYDYVAEQSKGTQTVEQLRTAIDAPDATETVSTNSGVYEYNASVFGTASDDSSACTRADGCPIYYYRGILDSYGHTGTYGSDGDNDAFPNTVVLSSASSKSGLTTNDTCWRIVRTTGSGGVKMIYQGKWTGSTCANAQTNAQVATSAFSGTSSTNRQIVRVGYTYNSTYAENTSKSGTIAQIFGSNSNPAANDTRSTIKEYIEDTWYPSAIGASSDHDYTSKLEASAGYCNDRTMNTTDSWTTPLAESTTIASTYGTSGLQAYYFGARPRTASTAQSPSLTCGNKYSQIDRSTVDLYRYVSGSTGVSNQLKYPAALLTVDEAAFAGSGSSASTTPYHANSFLRSGSRFWLLSPNDRDSSGYASGFALNSSGSFDYGIVNGTLGVRPAISLTSGTTATSGSGTATDPWVVTP